VQKSNWGTGTSTEGGGGDVTRVSGYESGGMQNFTLIYTALFHHKMVAKNRIETGLN